MAEEVDTIARHTFTKERQLQAMSELSYHQPKQPFQQDHASSYPQLTQGQVSFLFDWAKWVRASRKHTKRFL